MGPCLPERGFGGWRSAPPLAAGAPHFGCCRAGSWEGAATLTSRCPPAPGHGLSKASSRAAEPEKGGFVCPNRTGSKGEKFLQRSLWAKLCFRSRYGNKRSSKGMEQKPGKMEENNTNISKALWFQEPSRLLAVPLLRLWHCCRGAGGGKPCGLPL